MKSQILFAVLTLAATLGHAAERIVSLGGPVTETVYALGAGDLLVGADTSSVYPTAATKLPQVGYQRTVAAEGVLALRPTLVLATDEAGPPATLEQIRGAGVKVVLAPSGHSVAGAQAKVRAIAAALGKTPEGERLAAEIGRQAAEAQAIVAKRGASPGVLFLYARGGGVMNVAGAATAADAMITLAGGRNAVSGYENYRPLTAEAAVAAAPDVILTLDRGLASVGGVEKLLEQPGLSLTPAGKAKRVLAFDDLYLLGFGPRTGAAIADLAKALAP